MKYEVGKFYRVPCVQALVPFRWAKAGEWLAVLLPQHDDAEILKFPDRHYHIDQRFLPRRRWRAEDWEPFGAAIVEFAINRSPYPELTGERERATSPLELRRKKCLRRMPDWYPGGMATWMKALEEAYKDVRMKGLICPHRGVDLSDCPVVNGVICCPAHGLLWNAETGCLVRAPKS